MTQQAARAYGNNQVLTASPGEILLALHDGAIRFSRLAQEAIRRGDPAEKGAALGRVMGIINELNSTLDFSRAPELCGNLEKLYVYMIERLQIAGYQMDATPIDEVVRHLQGLRETWSQAIAVAGRSEEAK